jgi:hypothetical protein
VRRSLLRGVVLGGTAPWVAHMLMAHALTLASRYLELRRRASSASLLARAVDRGGSYVAVF